MSTSTLISQSLAPRWLRFPATTDTASDLNTCVTCGTAASVAPVRLTEVVGAGVQYWTCKACGLVWGTRGTPAPSVDRYSCTCPECLRPGRARALDPHWEHHYLCAACGARWKVPAVVTVEA